MNSKFSSSIIERIKKENIEMRPRWHFLLKNWIFWILFGISILLGSLAFAAIIFESSEIESEFLTYLSLAEIILKVLPLFWMFFLGIFLSLAILGIRHTKKGYKLNPIILVVLSAISSIILGSIIYAFDGGRLSDEILTNKVHFFPGMQKRHEQVWANPKNGLLGGKILEVSNNKNEFLLEDPLRNIWIVNYEKVPKQMRAQIKKEMMVKSIGKKIGNNKFEANIVKPWLKPGCKHMPNFINGQNNPKKDRMMKDRFFLPPPSK